MTDRTAAPGPTTRTRDTAATRRYGAELRIYDNGGRTADRYTLIPPRYAGPEWRERARDWVSFGCSAHPFHPQGIGMHGAAEPGPHLGRRIAWRDLPPDVQRAARYFAPEFCPTDHAAA